MVCLYYRNKRKRRAWFMKKKDLSLEIAVAAALIGAGVYAYKKCSNKIQKKFYLEVGSGVKIKKGTIIPIKNKFTWDAETDEVISSDEEADKVISTEEA
jgi:hypothetical protein